MSEERKVQKLLGRRKVLTPFSSLSVGDLKQGIYLLQMYVLKLALTKRDSRQIATNDLPNVLNGVVGSRIFVLTTEVAS